MQSETLWSHRQLVRLPVGSVKLVATCPLERSIIAWTCHRSCQLRAFQEIKAMYEFMLRNSKLYTAYNGFEPRRLGCLLSGETGGGHVALHKHHQCSTHVYSRISSDSVLPAATLALSKAWCHTHRIVVAFSAQCLAAGVLGIVFESTARGRVSCAVHNLHPFTDQ